MKLNANQLAFIFHIIEEYEGYGDFTSDDYKYSLTEDEVDELIDMFMKKLQSISNN